MKFHWNKSHFYCCTINRIIAHERQTKQIVFPLIEEFNHLSNWWVFDHLIDHEKLDVHLECFVLIGLQGVKWKRWWWWWWSNAMWSVLNKKQTIKSTAHTLLVCVSKRTNLYKPMSECIEAKWQMNEPVSSSLSHLTAFVRSPQAKIKAREESRPIPFIFYLTFVYECVCVRFEIECFCLLTLIESIRSFLCGPWWWDDDDPNNGQTEHI